MALHGIGGSMGAGKSFEAVSEKIVTSMRRGQKVVSTIEGLDHEAFAEYLEMDIDEVRRLLDVRTNEELHDDSAWYHPEENPVAIVGPGVHLVYDEAWDLFESDCKISPRIRNYIAMHRHWTAPDSTITGDITLITQDLSGLHRYVKNRMAMRFECRKQSALGRTDKYSLYMFEGKSRKETKRETKPYDPKIFPLYKSHANGGATELHDKRQSVFNSKFFKIVLPLAFVGIIAGGVFAYHQISHMSDNKAFNKNPTATQSAGLPPPVAPAGSSSTAQATPGAPATLQPQPLPSASDWRVIASYNVGTLFVVEMVNSKGQYKKFTSGSYTKGASDDLAVRVPDEKPGYASPSTGPAMFQQAESKGPSLLH